MSLKVNKSNAGRSIEVRKVCEKSSPDFQGKIFHCQVEEDFLRRSLLAFQISHSNGRNRNKAFV